MPKIIIFIIILLFTISISGQSAPAGFDLSNYGVRIDADKRLIVVLATLEMARTANGLGGYVKLINTPLSEKGSKFRDQLLADNAGLSDDLRNKISIFVTQYKKRHAGLSDAEIVAPFISMAYTLTPAPELGDPVITDGIPGSVLDVLDFAPLVREFYRRSDIGGRIDNYVRDYRQAADGVLRDSTRDMVSELLSYLHTRPELFFSERVKVQTSEGKNKKQTIQKIETREHARHFNVVPEMLAPKSNVNFLNIRDDYFVILPPDKDLSFSEVRRAFLQFVIDPLVLKNAKEIGVIRDWAKPILDDRRKTEPNISPDVFLMVTRSLVAAIDTRQSEFDRFRIATTQARQKLSRLKTDGERKAVTDELDKYKHELADEALLQLFEDYQKGSLLSFYFADQLKGVEEAGFDFAGSLREMIASFDHAKEPDRVTTTAEARKRALATREYRKNHQELAIIDQNPITMRLFEIQKTIDTKNYAAAAADLKKLLADNPSDPRIYYNIGRVASLSAVGLADQEVVAQKLQEAKAAYSNVLRKATKDTDKALLSLTYFALGRIYEFFNDNGYAMKLYEETIKLDDVAGGAFQDAISAKQRLLKPQ